MKQKQKFNHPTIIKIERSAITGGKWQAMQLNQQAYPLTKLACVKTMNNNLCYYAIHVTTYPELKYILLSNA